MNASKRTAAIRKIRQFCENELRRAGVTDPCARVTRDLAAHGVVQWPGKKLRAVAAVC